MSHGRPFTLLSRITEKAFPENVGPDLRNSLKEEITSRETLRAGLSDKVALEHSLGCWSSTTETQAQIKARIENTATVGALTGVPAGMSNRWIYMSHSRCSVICK
jgi:hypothetical protein